MSDNYNKQEIENQNGNNAVINNGSQTINNNYIGIIPEKTIKIIDAKLFLTILFGCFVLSVSIVILLDNLNIDCHDAIGYLIVYTIFPLTTYLLNYIFNYNLLYIYKDKLFLEGNEIKFSKKFVFNIKSKQMTYVHNEETKPIEFLYRQDLKYLKDKVDTYLENHPDS